MPLLLFDVITQQNTNLTAVWNFQHGRTHHHGVEVIKTYMGTDGLYR